MGVPIHRKGELMGVLCLFRSEHRRFSDEEATLLSAVSEQLGTAVENARLFSAAQDAAIVEERQRLAGELHDSVTQLMYSDVLLAEASRQMMSAGDLAAADHYLGRIAETAQQALKEMRLMLFELWHPGPEQESLVDALRRRLDSVERRAGVVAEMRVAGVLALPAPVEAELLRVAGEALNNALKHSSATCVTVDLRNADDRVEMIISDNGKGFDPSTAARSGGLGLSTMRERMERLGGQLSIESAAGAGTIVRAMTQLVEDRTAPRSGIDS